MGTKCAKCNKEREDLPLIRWEDSQPVCPACLLKELPNVKQIYLLKQLEIGKNTIAALQSHVERITVNGGGYCPLHEKVSFSYNKDGKGSVGVENTIIQAISKIEITVLWQSQTLCLACFMRKFPEPANKLIEFLSEKLAPTFAAQDIIDTRILGFLIPNRIN